MRYFVGSLSPSSKALLLICALLVLASCSRTHVLTRPPGEALEREGKKEEAIVSYRAQLARIPAADTQKHSQIQYRIGECLLALNRSTEAFTAFRRATEFDDTNSMAHLRLGQLYMEAGDPEKSSEQALTVLQQAGPNAEALALIGSAASANGNLSIARYFFERAQSLAPAEIKFSLALAEVYDRMGNGEKARKVLNDITKLRPSSAAPWLALGRMEESDGHIDAAETDYRQAVATENTPEANLRLAQFLERSSQPTAAEDVFRRVDQMKKSLPVALADYEFRTGRTDLAVMGYRRALSMRDELWRSLRLASLIRSADRDWSQIVPRMIEAELETATAANSPQKMTELYNLLQRYRGDLDSATYGVLLAQIAIAENDLEKADDAVSAALQQAPDSAAAHYVAGLIHEREGNISGARFEWQTALEKDSGFIPARVVLAEDVLKASNYAAAQKLTIVVLRAEPGNRRALVAFARASIGLRQLGAARAIASRLQALVPDAPEVNLIMADLAAAENKAGDALRFYEAALGSDSHLNEAVEGLTRIYGGTSPSRVDVAQALAGIEKSSIDIAKANPNASPSSAARLEALGRALARQGKLEDAERCLRESLQLDSSRSGAAESLARLQADDGKEESARNSAAHVRRLYPLLAAMAADERHKGDAAVALYEAAVRRGDPTGYAANNLAWLYAVEGRNLDRALTLATRALQMHPSEPAIADTLGYVFLRRREYSHAVAALERARDLRPDSFVGDSIKRHLAEAYLRAGDSDRAASLLAELK